MAYDGSLKFDTSIDSKGFTDGLSKLKNIAKSGVSAVENVAKVASTVITTVSGGMIGAGTAATKVGMDFDAAMSKVAAISGTSGDSLQALTDKAKKMGAATKFSATESAEAFQYMAMAGWDTEKMLGGIDGIMNLAAADGLDLATTSDIVTDAITAFGLSASDSTHFADVLAKTSSSANTNVSMLGESFKYVAPLAGSMNYSVEDVSLALGLMANASVKGSMAGTGLKTALSNLASPTKNMENALVKLGLATAETSTKFDQLEIDKATIKVTEAQEKYDKALKEYGENSTQAEKAALNLKSAQQKLEKAQAGTTNKTNITVTALKNADGSTKSLKETLTELRKAFKNLDETQQAEYASTIFGKEAMSGMLAIINASEDDFNKLTKSIDNSDGAAKKMADTLNNNLKGDITIMKSTLEGFGIAIEETLDSGLRNTVQQATGYIQQLSEAFTNGGLSGAVKEAGNIFGELATKAAENAPNMINAALDFIDSFAEGIANNDDKLLQAGKNIVQSVIDGIIRLSGHTADLVNGATTLIKSFVREIKNNKTQLLGAAKEIVKAITDGLVSLLPKEVQTPVKKCVDTIKKLFQSNALKKAIQSVSRFIGEMAKTIANVASNVIPAFAKVIEFLCNNLDAIGPAVITIITAWKSYKAAAELARIAQLGLNGAMSANPIGAVITLVGTLVTGLSALCGWLNKASDDEEELKEAEERLNDAQQDLDASSDDLADSFSQIGKTMQEFRDDVDNAESSMSNFDESLIIPESTKQALQKDMEETQGKIDEIVKRASDERRKLTEDEVKELDKLIKKQLDLANKNLELVSRHQNVAEEKTKTFVQNFDGNAEEFSEQSKSYLKGADEAYEKVVAAADEKYDKQLTYAMSLKGTAKKYDDTWYKKQTDKIWKDREKDLKAAQEKKSKTYSIITDEYSSKISVMKKFNDATDKYGKDLNNIEKWKLKKRNELQQWYDDEYEKIKKNGVEVTKKINVLNNQMSTKQAEAQEEYLKKIENAQKYLSKCIDKESTEQIGSLIALAKETSKNGGKVSDDTALMVYNVKKALKNLPDDVKEKMGDSYDEMIKAFDGVPDKVYKQGKAAADKLRQATGKELSDDMRKNGSNAVQGFIDGMVGKWPDVKNMSIETATITPLEFQKKMDMHSPSRLMAKLGRFTMEGLMIGLEDKGKSLVSTASNIVSAISETMKAGLSNQITPNIELGNTDSIMQQLRNRFNNAELVARLKAAVQAEVGLTSNIMTARHRYINVSDTDRDSKTIKASGNIQTHINIDGREFAIVTAPYINEELAFTKG